MRVLNAARQKFSDYLRYNHECMLMSIGETQLFTKKMARKTKEEALETKKAIIAAAISVFVEQGVSKASLEEIAERAGVTRGAVYWHFKNKDDIFRALQEEMHNSIMETVLADLESDHPEPLKQLEARCLEFLYEMENNQVKKDIKRIFYIKCDYSGDMAQTLARMNAAKKECMPFFARYFEKAQKIGHIAPDADPTTLAIALNCYMQGIIFEYLRNPGVIDLERQGASLVRHFFKGLNVLSD